MSDFENSEQRRSSLALSSFNTDSDYSMLLHDENFWNFFVEKILKHHGLSGREIIAGIGGTFPAFICGDVVVKLFGYVRAWRESFASERAAHKLLATDSEIAAPRLIAEGELFCGAEESWPCLITTRMPGVNWKDDALSEAERIQITADLGRQLRRVHQLQPSPDIAALAHWQNLNVSAAAKQSSLPPHLADQIDDFLGTLDSFEPAFVHSDIVGLHVFVDKGRLAGIIDWGDAMVNDRHYEIIQIYRDLFDCNKELLKIFLEASSWQIGSNFPKQALGLAFYRQAIGLTRHLTIDVFEPISKQFPLRDIASLDELAEELFGGLGN
ncbi:phosphotransferase family protein [Alteribacillus sp. HJP-4]|uniref:phosphotransferase family protein n=1 Tax=Alteribacillus sp. HJP-4 TaxID=2775394 RepID=UPI0035CD2BF7